jgi:hypothetical protein
MLTDKTGTLEVGDKRAWTLPDGTIALHNYFKNEAITFALNIFIL